MNKIITNIAAALVICGVAILTAGTVTISATSSSNTKKVFEVSNPATNATPTNTYNSKVVDISEQDGVVSYRNKAMADAASIATVQGGIVLKFMADPVPSSKSHDHNEDSVRYMIYTHEYGLKELSIDEHVSIATKSIFDGSVIVSGDKLTTVNAEITLYGRGQSAIPAVKNHVVKNLVVTSGPGTAQTATQAKNIATKAATYWKTASNGSISSFTVDTPKTYTSNVCNFSDDNLFLLLLSQYGYTTESHIINFLFSTPSTITTLVISLPSGCGKNYAGLALIGDGINSNGVVIQQNTLSGMLTNSDGTSLQNNTYVDETGAYNVRSLAHEIGHTFGLGHSGSYNATIGWQAYEDFYSIQGSYSSYTIPTLDGYYREWLGLSDSGNNEKVGIPMSDPLKIATTFRVNAIDSSTVANRYVKILDQNTGRSYYFEYRSGANQDNRAFYMEKSYLHISTNNYCFKPGFTLAIEADGLPGAPGGGGMGNAGPGYPDVAIMSASGKTNYDATNTNQCYHAWYDGDILLTNTFQVHTYNKTTSYVDVKIEPLNNPFGDIAGSTFQSNILWLYRNGIAAGNPAYSPDSTVTRGQMAAFIYRAAGKPAFTPSSAELSKFTDIEYPDFKNAILWMYHNGITNGYNGGSTYGTNDTVTRGQMAAFIYRAASSPVYAPTNAEKLKFADIANSGFEKEILWLSKNNITNGLNGTNQYGPDYTVNRGQMAAFLNRVNANVTHYAFY
jgi:hypothetical protein